MLIKAKKIRIGEWILVKSSDPTKLAVEVNGQSFYYYIGNLLGFKYIDEKNKKKQSKLEVASTLIDPSKKGVHEILGVFYDCDDNSALTLKSNEKNDIPYAELLWYNQNANHSASIESTSI